MQVIQRQEALEQLLSQHPAALLLYGGQHCGVCQTLKSRLAELVAKQFPLVTTAYIDCQASGATLCAQQRIMTLPVVQIWFDGQRFSEFYKVFSLADIQEALIRPYQLKFG